MKPVSNYVHVRLSRNDDQYVLSNGHKIFIDSSFLAEEHRPATGKVLAICDKLNYSENNVDGMDWKTKIEIELGDEVIFRRAAVALALKNGMLERNEEGTCDVFIKYQDFILAKRECEDGDLSVDGKNYKVVMLNGYILCEPIEQTTESKIKLPFVKYEKDLMKVCYVGSNNEKYLNKEYLPDENIQVKPGDVILTKGIANLQLEYEMHRSFAGRKNMFYRLQRNKILAICN